MIGHLNPRRRIIFLLLHTAMVIKRWSSLGFLHRRRIIFFLLLHTQDGGRKNILLLSTRKSLPTQTRAPPSTEEEEIFYFSPPSCVCRRRKKILLLLSKNPKELQRVITIAVCRRRKIILLLGFRCLIKWQIWRRSKFLLQILSYEMWDFRSYMGLCHKRCWSCQAGKEYSYYSGNAAKPVAGCAISEIKCFLVKHEPLHRTAEQGLGYRYLSFLTFLWSISICQGKLYCFFGVSSAHHMKHASAQ